MTLRGIPGRNQCNARMALNKSEPAKTSIHGFIRTLARSAGLAQGLLLSLPSIPDSTEADGVLREIARTLRRICLLQETGRSHEASALEPMRLIPLIRSFRDSHGPDSLPDRQIRDLYARERERALDAAALAEILAPLLIEQLSKGLPGALHPPPLTSDARPSPASPRASAGAPEIADLLDGMLAQENAPAAGRTHRRP